ncbi:unknown protein [Microcystis aeruginosa NIES-843]|uniref:Uncharacterized protein n=1 Tax=Microcystis aeruginosa (strain NIES-843 / IAM M-2473) TaxID=449447 RepID=B0JHA0_MICAN|nr:unknown protein [Microcystis aeruginosa NIES-843]
MHLLIIQSTQLRFFKENSLLYQSIFNSWWGFTPPIQGKGRRMITKVIKLSTTPVIFW